MSIRNKLLASAIALAFVAPAYAQDATTPAQPTQPAQPADPAMPAPGTTAPGTTDPNTAAPNATAPGTADSNTTAPNTAAPGTADSNTTAPNTAAPGTTDPNMKPADGTVATDSNAANQTFYTATTSDAPLFVSQVMGKAVYNTANENIGEIEEIIIGKDGKVAAAVIGVGGFLGMGERKVAVAFPALKMVPDEAGATKIVVSIDRPALESAPAYEPGKING